MADDYFILNGEDMSAGVRLMRFNIEGGDEQLNVSPAPASGIRAFIPVPSPLRQPILTGEGSREPKHRRLDSTTGAYVATTESDGGSPALLGALIPNALPIDTEISPLSPNTKRRMRFNLEDEKYFSGDLNNIRHDILYYLATRHSHQHILDLVNKYHPGVKFASRDLSYRMNGCMKSRARHSNRHRREIKADLDAERRENGVEFVEGRVPEEVDEGPVDDERPVDDEIFEEHPSLLKGDRLIDLEARYTHSQIVSSVNYHHPEANLNNITLAERLKDAILVKAKREERTYAEVRAELDAFRKANGTSYAHQNGSFTTQRAGLLYLAPASAAGAPMETNDDAPETPQVVDIIAILDDHPDNLRGQTLIDLASQMSYPDILSEVKARHPSSMLEASNLSSRLQSALKSKALKERKPYEQVRNELTDLQRANNLANVKKVHKRRAKAGDEGGRVE